MNTLFVPQYHSALIDTVTGAVLTTGTSLAALMFLKECTSDSWVAGSVNYPHYMGSFLPLPFFLASIDPIDFPKWTWDHKARKFLKTRKELLDERLLGRSLLAESKREFITKMMDVLTTARSGMLTGVNFQDKVYLIKTAQAQAFKDLGYDESAITQYLYVLQYADLLAISLRQAADDILFKAKLDEEFLLKTEFLRLKYFDRVKKATMPEELPAIHEEFIRVAYLNAQI